MKIRKGDIVQIISGKDKGKSGKVMKVDVSNSAVLLEGLNMFKKHIRPKRQGAKGQTLSLPRPLNISKIMLFCPNCKKAVRTGYRFSAGDGSLPTGQAGLPTGQANASGGGNNSGLKVRYCKKCKGVL